MLPHRFTSAEKIIAVLTLFYYTSITTIFVPVNDVFHTATFDDEYSSARLAFVPAYVVILGLCAGQYRRVLAALGRNLPILTLLLLPLLSTLWSAAPDITLRRSIALLASMLFGTYLAVRYQPMEVLRMLAWALALTLLLSGAIVLAWPSRGVMISPYEGAWRGVFTHKNDLARMMLLNIVAVLVLLGSAQRYRKLLWIDLVASVIVLVEAQSATAFLCAMILGASAVMLAVCLRRPRYAPAVLALLPVLALAAWLSVDAVLAALGRDLTLTGRTGLWQAVWPMIEARLWLGYGYQAFWIDPNGPAAVVWALAGWQAPSAHNGYLDLWLGLGLIGIVIFAAVFLQTLIRALRLARTVEGPRTYWTLLFLAMFLAYGFSEIVFMQQNDLFTVLFVLVALHSRLGAGRQLRRPPARVAPPARRPVAASLVSTR